MQGISGKSEQPCSQTFHKGPKVQNMQGSGSARQLPSSSLLCRNGGVVSGIVPGWYLDPDGKPCERYWDGEKWTSDTRPRMPGQSSPPSPRGSETRLDQREIVLLVVIALVLLVILFS